MAQENSVVDEIWQLCIKKVSKCSTASALTTYYPPRPLIMTTTTMALFALHAKESCCCQTSLLAIASKQKKSHCKVGGRRACSKEQENCREHKGINSFVFYLSLSSDENNIKIIKNWVRVVEQCVYSWRECQIRRRRFFVYWYQKRQQRHSQTAGILCCVVYVSFAFAILSYMMKTQTIIWTDVDVQTWRKTWNTNNKPSTPREIKFCTMNLQLFGVCVCLWSIKTQ